MRSFVTSLIATKGMMVKGIRADFQLNRRKALIDKTNEVVNIPDNVPGFDISNIIDSILLLDLLKAKFLIS
jgi:hypothetical protein